MNRTALALLELLAVCLLGTMSGFFFAFAIDVAPAMRQLDAAGYIATQQWINSTVRNAAFAIAYFGAALLPFVVAACAFFGGRKRTALAWAVVGAVYFGAVFWITRSVNIPINNELAAWNPAAAPPNWTEARDLWNHSNVVRTVAAALSFAGAAAILALRPLAGGSR